MFKKPNQSDPDFYLKREAWRRRRLNHLYRYKERKGCEECGFKGHFSQLTWDHIDPAQKEFEINMNKMDIKLKRIFKEIRKCRVLCWNCHMLHSFTSGHWGSNKRTKTL